MAQKKEIERIMRVVKEPFSSSAFDTFTAAWAVTKRKKFPDVERQESDDRVSGTGESHESELPHINTGAFFGGQVLDTFTAAWEASKDKIKPREKTLPDNGRIIRQIYAHLVRAGMQGDMRPILQPLAEEIVWVSTGPPAIPWSGTVRGREQVAQWYAKRGAALRVETLLAKDFIVQGNRVVVLSEENGRVNGTGEAYRLDLVGVWTLLHGMVTQYREWYDTAEMVGVLTSS